MTFAFVKAAAKLATLLSLAATPVFSQTISQQESASYYANVRGWAVSVIGDGRGLFACRAVRGHGYNDQIMIEYDGFSESWRVMVRGIRPSGDGGGTKGAGVYYDGQFVDRQIYFGSPGYDGTSNTHAKLDLMDWELAKLKSGNTVRIDINGEHSRSWSLSGTTAASLKVAECAANSGFGPAVISAPVPAPAVAPRAQAAMLDVYSVGYVRHNSGQFKATGGGNWVEEGDNGSVFYFVEYGRTEDGIFLNDPSRNMQIWIALEYDSINYTSNFNTNGWSNLYPIQCFDRQASRSC